MISVETLYQPERMITFPEISRRVHVPVDPAEMILNIGPCRSGSTLTLRIFAAGARMPDNQPIPTYYQPFKAILRWFIQGQEGEGSQFYIPGRSQKPMIYLKETIGPYTALESTFNPLDVLLPTGYPPDKLRLVFMMRNPLDTFASWVTKWGDRVRREKLLENFITAFYTVEAIRWQAEQLGITRINFAYDFLGNYEAEVVVQRLFAQLGLQATAYAVRGWEELPPIDSLESGIVFAGEPKLYEVAGLHQEVMGRGIEYHSYGEAVKGILSSGEIREIEKAGLVDIYDRFYLQSKEDLGL